MEKECISKEPIQFANDTQLENTTRMMKGFKWIYNDPSVSYNTWENKEETTKPGLNYFPSHNSAVPILNEEQLARLKFSREAYRDFRRL